MSLGTTLRSAREACGFTTSELAARTHMLVQIVEGLENEDFRRIPAPIYGRGFIKLYCEAVNLDPKPLQAEFMDLFNRAKDEPAKAKLPPVRSRPQTQEPPPQSMMAPTPEVAAPLPSEQQAADSVDTSLFDLPIQTQNPVPAVNIQPPPKRSYGDIFGQSYATEEEPPRQSAAEKFRNTMSNVSSGVFANVQKLPPNTARIVAVSLCAVLILGLIVWGVFELYKATTPGGNSYVEPIASAEVAEKNPTMEQVAETKGKNGKKGETKDPASTVKPGDLKSSGIEVPALYID